MLGRCLGRRLASSAAAAQTAFPISAALRIADVSGRLRQMNEAEMRRKFELDSTVSVADAVKHLAQHRLTFVCVTDRSQGGRIVGAFSERDYLRYAVRAESSAFFSGVDATTEPIVRAMTGAERMLSLRNETTVFTALSMIQHKIWRHLPILDDSERLEAVLDIRDLLLALDGGRSDAPGGHLRSVWHGRCVADILRTKRRDKVVEGTNLELYLRTRAASHTIASSSTVERAAQQMARERLTFLVVVEEEAQARRSELFVPSPFEKNRVVGLVNERDFVRFGAEHEDGLGEHARTPVGRGAGRAPKRAPSARRLSAPRSAARAGGFDHDRAGRGRARVDHRLRLGLRRHALCAQRAPPARDRRRAPLRRGQPARRAAADAARRARERARRRRPRAGLDGLAPPARRRRRRAVRRA